MIAILLLLQSPTPVVERITPFTTQRLQAVSVAGRSTVWVSGTGGTWGLTVDGGTTWVHGVVPGADSLEFRDVQAVDANRAYLLAAGPGDRSRIYKTTDRGASWSLQFTNQVPDAFYDCFAFWDSTAGFAVSDAVNGVLPILRTLDGGTKWELSPSPPAAVRGEGAFAASGTCVATWYHSMGWIATGAGETARVLTTTDGGATWSAVATPIIQGKPTSGHTSVAFWDRQWGVAAGGDIADTGSTDVRRMVRTRDGGVTWTPVGAVTFRGAIYGVALQRNAAIDAGFGPMHAATLLAVGPGGASWSRDRGTSWEPLDSLSYWSVAFHFSGAAWLVGPAGRISRISVPDRPKPQPKP